MTQSDVASPDRPIYAAPRAFRLVCWLAVVQIVLWTLLPALVHPNAPLDVIEGLSWGREFQLGYYRHPPLQAWLLELAVAIGGKSSIVFFLLSQIMIGATYLLVWAMAREWLEPWRAWLAVALTSGIAYFSFLSPEFNENVLQMPFWAGTIWAFWRALARDRLRDWVWAGLFAALSLYAKYSAAFLLVSLALATLTDPVARSRLLGRRAWVGLAVFLILLAPNAVWVIGHDFQPFHYAVGRTIGCSGLTCHATVPGRFLIAQMADHIGLVLIAAVSIYGGGLTVGARSGELPRDRPVSARRYMMWAGLGPVGVALAGSALFGLGLRDMWGAPMFDLSGILAVISTTALMPDIQRAWPISFRVAVGLTSACAIGFALVHLLAPSLSAKPQRGDFPGPALAQELDAIWLRHTDQPLRIVIGSTWLAGNVAFYSPTRPHVLIDGDLTISPWLAARDLSTEGALIVWPGGSGGVPSAYRPAHASIADQGIVTLPQRSVWSGSKDIRVAWAILLPVRASPRD